MFNRLWRSSALLIALSLGATPTFGQIHWTVSVVPLKTFVEKVGAPHARADVMVRPGYSPATYEPTPQQIAALAQTRLYMRIGVPFEAAWMHRLISANPEMEILDARQGIAPKPIAAHRHAPDGAPHDGQPVADHNHQQDPHVWTDPNMVIRIAGTIRDVLIRQDPQHADDYRRNHDRFVAELSALDDEIRDRLATLKQRKFMVYHPAWGYFAAAYDLRQVPIEKEGKAVGAQSLGRLIQQARREGIRVIFVQPQFSQQSAQQLAREIPALVTVIDPLAADYTDNLRRVSRLLAEGIAH
jgi:zinc transport system substrate-binding protein